MTIGDLFVLYPDKSQRLAQELTNAGLACAGCHAAVYETLEAGMLGHGMDDAEIDEVVERLNMIVLRPTDNKSITLTERAAERFKQILKQDGKEGHALRFADKPGGCGGFEYVLDISKGKEEDDLLFLSRGVDIHVKKSMESRLLGSEIDYVEGLMGAGFKVVNPNVRGSCSCGQSQSY
ncbi:MAG: iron-sulfur cluster assembly accessory protein [Simkaniaceae bacterium]|nr:iron-sulfur cluster assembly accessory protein [Simkaniaceae bacterium]